MTSSRAATTARILRHFEELIASSVLTNDRIARSLGMNVVDWQAFGVIVRSGRHLTAGEISALTQLPTSTTTRVLDRLERAGFVERTSDPADRRRVVVVPRPEVVARFRSDGEDNPYSAITGRMEEVHEGFTTEELAVVERYLRAVNEAF
ncbi:helix-turn-helix domain-containing protein [uncultured Georgenia sp.]|mgnify:FL=1|uniref:MarR family winged helix-turn-helix transcriptional regulator n=1 Tax=uncultured Georgenia sp. TaxID=378209 RepID=UPI0026278F04|nr:helix-turn-helix domain-containing protein [uncultured Georgenia sp.]